MVSNAISREILKNVWLGYSPLWFDRAADLSYPRFNTIETKEGYQIEVAVPGWKKDELAVTLRDNELRITGSKRSSEGGDPYLHQGLSRKSFDRFFVLNPDLLVDSVKLEDGILAVNIKKDISKEISLEIQ